MKNRIVLAALVVSVFSACSSAPTKSAQPTLIESIGALSCTPAAHEHDTAMLSYSGFTLKTDKAIAVASQTFSGRMNLKFDGPVGVHAKGDRKVVGAVDATADGKEISVDAGKIGLWSVQLNLMTGKAKEISVMTLTRKKKSGAIFGTETYRFAAHCSEAVASK